MGVRRGGQASECADTAGHVISDSPWEFAGYRRSYAMSVSGLGEAWFAAAY